MFKLITLTLGTLVHFSHLSLFKVNKASEALSKILGKICLHIPFP